MRLCDNPSSAQAGNDKLETLAETKLLNFNSKKTFVMFMGNKKAREKLEDDFSENPPKLYGKEVKVVPSETYLGDRLGKSVSDSITLTIDKRKGLVKKSIMEIKSIMEDFRSKELGAIKIAVLT